jgi:carbon-monoxide dehydrogenase large subunit
LEAAAKDIILRDGAVHVQGAPHITLSFRELAALASPAQWQRPEAEPGLEVTTHFQASKSTYGTGSAAVVLEVDIETGQITIWRTVIAYDVGRAINPMLVEGQIIGGAVQGLSGALLEELRYDDSGQLLTATFMDYLLPTAADVPVVETHLLEDTPSQLNPLGVKGVGEGGIAGMGGAVANAVADALRPLGVKVTELPLHPNAVYQALHRR